MDKSIFYCRNCTLMFDEQARAPHIIPSCGHSICKQCLASHFVSGEEWRCGEANCVVKRELRLGDFPLNHSLFKMVSIQNSQYFSASHYSNQDRHQESNLITDKKQNESYFNLSKEDHSSRDQIQAVPKAARSASPKPKCAIHGHKTGVVCVEPCQKMICYECGLFGEHKVR